MSSNNQNLEQEQEHEQSFWKRTLIGIPFWLLALILVIVLLYLAYKQDYFASWGLGDTHRKGNVVLQREMLSAPKVSPVENRLAFDNI
jgi:hypothetical protein